MRDIGRLFACLLLSGVFLAAPARSDYRTAYRKGIGAFEKGNWADVEREMKGAVAERSAEGGPDVLISGSFRKAYLPHYFLGLAQARQSNCISALASFRKSLDSGAIQGSRELETLRKEQQQCFEREYGDDARQVQQSLQSLRGHLLQAKSGGAGPLGAEEAKRLESAISEIETNLNKATATNEPANLEVAKTAVVRADGIAKPMLERLAAAPKPANIPPPAAALPAATGGASTTQTATLAKPGAPSGSGEAGTATPATVLREAAAPTVPDPARAALETCIQQLKSGRARDCSSALEARSSIANDSRVLLLLAVANHTLAIEDPDRADYWIGKARASVTKLFRQKPALRLDAGLFSPRFRAFAEPLR